MTTQPTAAATRAAEEIAIQPGKAIRVYQRPSIQWGVICYAPARETVTVHHVAGEFSMVQKGKGKPFICETKSLRQKLKTQATESR